MWSLCYAWLGLWSVDSFNPHSHFLPFNLSNVSNDVNLVLRNVWIAVVNEIWHVRNNIVFEGGEAYHSEAFSLAHN